MRQALLRGQVKAFGDLLDQSWRLKKLHNNAVTNSLIESCYDKARKIGALGGKLLGAGSGGYLLMYAAPLYHKDLEFELEQLGAKRQPLNFSSKGVEVWKVKR
jgi:D-glycero-alpha-D-manno-heptose-7-phosphate kinase